MIKSLVQDSGKYTLGLGVAAAIEIIRIPIVARLFDLERFGAYALALSASTLLAVLSTAWLGAAVIRFAPAFHGRDRKREFNRLTWLLGGGSTLVVSTAAAVCCLWWRQHIPLSAAVVWSGIGLAATMSVEQVLLSLLRAQRHVGRYVTYSICQKAIGLSVGLVLVMLFGFGVEGMLWGPAIATCICLPFFSRLSASGATAASEPPIDRTVISEMLRYGIPVTAINLLTWVLSASDRYFIGFFRNDAEVGIYSAVYIVAEKTIFVIVSVFSLASIPITFSMWETGGLIRVQELLTKTCRMYMLIGLPCMAGLAVLARPVLGTLFSSQYGAAFAVVPLVSVGAFLMGIANIYTNVIAIRKRADILLFCYVGAAAVNLFLNWLLIPTYGYMAAAVTTLTGYAVFLGLTFVVSRRFFVWSFPATSLARISAASALMAVTVWTIEQLVSVSSIVALISVAAVGAAVYGGALLLVAEVSPAEIAGALSMLRRSRTIAIESRSPIV